MAPSFMATRVRYLVIKFLEQNISTGCIIFKEEDGTVLTFKGTKEKCPLEVVLKVHNPGQFYWKLMLEGDLGLADAFIQGEFSFEDEEEGLINLFLISAANEEFSSSVSVMKHRRGWWASAKFLLKHVFRQNTLTPYRHYDLGNDFYKLFLGETMQYSCGIFKTVDEDLESAQLRKMSSLIEKARIRREHEVLEIGFGWGSVGIEAVKRTGCKYTGINLSEEQLKYAEGKAREAGLQDNIKFLIRDWRQLPTTRKYDRIICWEMIEHIANEELEEFFRCLDSILAEDGLLVLQFTSFTEDLYLEALRSTDFVNEFMFPDGSFILVPLTRLLQAVAAGSRFSAEHVENIATHNYVQTSTCWRKNFQRNKSKILGMGFDENFMRTWEYYFCYTMFGFMAGMVKDYQVVFCRQGNFAALGDPFQGIPSAFSC